MKKKYQSPKLSKIRLDVEQALLTGCKIYTVNGAQGFAAQKCNKKCASQDGT
jgi:hypothetical protein